MLDKAIDEFLEMKKADFLKKNTKSDTSDEDKQIFFESAKQLYNLENWLIDASRRARQLSLTSHPAKLVHPNAKTSSIIADVTSEKDGLLRSGNVETELDVFGNAAALDVEKFLRIKLLDGKTVMQHLENNSDTIQQQLETEKVDFRDIRDAFMQIKSSELKQTSEKLKQVYFPVESDYHLLSILNASGIIYKLKHSINNLRFSEENKHIKEELKKSKPASLEGVITDLFGLSAIGYGGTKPQNISTLNNQNGGVSLLLPSMPPILKKRKTQPPKKDFFGSCLWTGLFKNDFEEFHKVLGWRRNNREIRDMRDDIVLNAITKLARIVVDIREIPSGWSDGEIYDGLAHWQKVWLDEKYADIRNDNKQNHQYLTHAQSDFAKWFIGNYKQATEDNKLLGDDDIEHIKKVLNDEQELFQ